ncbi:MAG: AEC family transporter [Rhodospirillaceae bacterium]|nr:AEC family transporter [Rhodospirillaceae bacterium]
MTGSGGAIVPIFLLIGLGYALKRLAFGDDRFWRGLDTLATYVLLPALLLRGLAGANLADVPLWRAATLAAAAVLLSTAFLYVAQSPLRLSGPAFTSVVQGGIRPNAYVAMAAILALYSEDGLSSAALAVAAFIPMVNIITAAALARYGKGGSGRALLRHVLLDPLVLACAAGLLVNLDDQGLPAWIDAILDPLGRAALPMGLLAMGAGLAFAGLRRGLGATLLSSAAKFGVLPGLVWAGLGLFGIVGADAGALLLFAAAPVSISSYLIARQMGGDHRQMASIFAVENVAAIAALPAWVGVVQSL